MEIKAKIINTVNLMLTVRLSEIAALPRAERLIPYLVDKRESVDLICIAAALYCILIIGLNAIKNCLIRSNPY